MKKLTILILLGLSGCSSSQDTTLGCLRGANHASNIGVPMSYEQRAAMAAYCLDTDKMVENQ